MTNRRINHEVVKWMFARCHSGGSWLTVNRGGFLWWIFRLWRWVKFHSGNVLMRINIFIDVSGAVDHKSIKSGFFTISNVGILFAVVECETWVAPLRVMSRKFQRQIMLDLIASIYLELEIYRFWSIVDLLIYIVTKQQNCVFKYSRKLSNSPNNLMNGSDSGAKSNAERRVCINRWFNGEAVSINCRIITASALLLLFIVCRSCFELRDE